jgi:ABC-2 type transport system ATP-binding protein
MTETKTGTGPVLIEVSHVSKRFGSINALSNVSFEVRRGDILGFLGPNGAGKSTAMKIVTCFLDADAGSVRVAGHDVPSESLAVRQKIGYLPENAPSYGEMTVAGFLEFICEARAVSKPNTAIARTVAETGLGSVLHQKIDTLSKGFKRRVGLAQALIHDPEVLILDEPTDGLDPNQKSMVQDLISRLAKGKAIVLSTHILDEVERICNRAIIISDGKILVDSTPTELIERAPNHNVIRVAVDEISTDLIEEIRALDWCDRVELDDDQILHIYPIDGQNHLSEALEMLEETGFHGLHLQEGRLIEHFRQVTQGVCR